MMSHELKGAAVNLAARPAEDESTIAIFDAILFVEACDSIYTTLDDEFEGSLSLNRHQVNFTMNAEARDGTASGLRGAEVNPCRNIRDFTYLAMPTRIGCFELIKTKSFMARSLKYFEYNRPKQQLQCACQSKWRWTPLATLLRLSYSVSSARFPKYSLPGTTKLQAPQVMRLEIKRHFSTFFNRHRGTVENPTDVGFTNHPEAKLPDAVTRRSGGAIVACRTSQAQAQLSNGDTGNCNDLNTIQSWLIGTTPQGVSIIIGNRYCQHHHSHCARGKSAY